MFNAEVEDLAMVGFNTATEAAAATDLARNNDQKTDKRAAAAKSQDHCCHADDIPIAMQQMMTSLLPRQALAEVAEASTLLWHAQAF